MHVFLLILTIAGQPERIAAICETYQVCSMTGEHFAEVYAAEHKLQPHAISYRVVPGVVAEYKGASL